jgi:hypothetical protein
VQFYGTIPNTPDNIRSLYKKLTKDGRDLHLCYEDGAFRRASSSAKFDECCGAMVHRRIDRRTSTLS